LKVHNFVTYCFTKKLAGWCTAHASCIYIPDLLKVKLMVKVEFTILH